MKILSLICLFILVACAHSIEKSLEKITPGMTRADVSDEVGSPLYIDRNEPERHIWVYRYYDKQSQQWVRKAVFFDKDSVERVGLAPERKVLLENSNSAPLDMEDLKPARRIKGSLKDQPGVGSEDWYQDIKRMEQERLQKEQQKTVPQFKKVN